MFQTILRVCLAGGGAYLLVRGRNKWWRAGGAVMLASASGLLLIG